jgi:mannosyltransferase OCH1-like enzyme
MIKYEQYRKKTHKSAIIHSRETQLDPSKDSIEAIDTKLIDFEGFNNNTGLECEYIVPNIIHFVHLNQPYIKFASFLSILAAWLNQKPAKIYFHCNDCGYKGKYWDEINKLKALRSIIIINKFENLNEKIFNLNPGWIHHKADTLRLLILMHYGGIYLDNDMLLIQSIDYYRRFEFALSWDSDIDGIGNQLLIANKNARLLRAMYDGYR